MLEFFNWQHYESTKIFFLERIFFKRPSKKKNKNSSAARLEVHNSDRSGRVLIKKNVKVPLWKFKIKE